MSAFEVEQPILNSPFEEPAEHWQIQEGAAPKRLAGRRTAGYFYRDPKATPEPDHSARGDWQALELVYDTVRQARYAEVKRSLQARFDREQEIQRDRARWVRRWRDWVNGLATRNAPDALIGLRAELVELREESSTRGDANALAALEEAGSRIGKWENEEAERQQALLAAAQASIETEAQASSAAASAQNEQQTGAARQQLHALLHTAEQALAAGQLKVARGVADQLRPLRATAGRLPPPTTKRIGQLMQSLTQLEKWETFGQQNARIQLCERAEALATETIDTARLAKEIHSLREAWKALDKQYAGVPKALWTRFDGACTKAYAPAAQFFAQRAAQRKVELRNLWCRDLLHLSHELTLAGRRLRKKPNVIQSFFAEAGLAL